MEVVKEDKKKRRRTRHDWSNPAESMMMRILEGAFGAKNVTKQPDRQQGYQDEGGKWHYFYANANKPDITFAAVYRGKLMDGVMEVKSVSPSSSGLGVDNIKPGQIREMEKDEDRIRLWGLVFWEEKGVARCFVIDHDGFMDIINEELPNRERGNFKGKSLRRKDLDLLDGCEVLKTNRWYLPEGHWYES
jgi:hypothetical protein